MTSAYNLPPEKSCIWLETLNHPIPLKVLKAPLTATFPRSNIKIGFLEDEFVIYTSKTEDSCLKVWVVRNRTNPKKTQDDGYVLRFYITVTGFDEKPQVSVMEHDYENAEPISVFKLSEKILAKINTTHYVFDVFVVVQMLEIKHIAEENEIKKNINKYIAFLRPRLTEQEFRDLCFILKCSAPEDAFTGRLPKAYTDEILYTIAFMAKNYSKVAGYLKARYGDEDSKYPNADVSSILKYVDMEDDERGPLTFDEACRKCYRAHRTGFDCMKTITSDYLLSFLDKDYDNVLRVLEVALRVHNEDLLDKAIFSFLNNFHKVIRSKKFEILSFTRPPLARLIMHFTRVWVTNNDVYIPGWKIPSQPTAA